MSLFLRYHNDEDSPCVTVFSMEPQYRSVLAYGGATMRVAIPHLFFVFNYRQVPGGYCFPGIYGNGLRVFVRNKPLTKLSDAMCSSPTDHPTTGQVCTDHRFDNMVFEDVEVLTGTIIDLWWNTPHYFYMPKAQNYDYYGSSWKDMTMEQVLSTDWIKAGTMRNIIGKDVELLNQPVGRLPSILQQNNPYGAPKKAKAKK